MIDILLYISNGLIIFSFIVYLFLILLNRKNKITSSNGFDTTKDILQDYNSINIIESTGYLTIYNIKRKVIKIASKCYYGNTLSDISLPLIESGISATHDNNNKYITFFSKIIPNLKCLYIFPIISMCINGITYNIEDAKIGIIITVISTIISYILIDIKNESFLWLNKNIKKVKNIDKEKIINFIKNIFLLDKVIFIGELIMIIRYVYIMLYL